MEKIDERGKVCPMPLFHTKKKIENMKPGEYLEVIIDDLTAKETIPKWSKDHGHEIVSVDDTNDYSRIVIKKKDSKNDIIIDISRRKLTQTLIGIMAAFITTSGIAAILKFIWPVSTSKSETSEILIAKVGDVQINNPKKFTFNGKAAILLKTEIGYRAFGAVCTHLGCIAYFKQDENLIFCPCHLGRYDRNTGAVISGPPPSQLPAIDITIKDGSIYALKWTNPAYVRSISFYAGAA